MSNTATELSVPIQATLKFEDYSSVQTFHFELTTDRKVLELQLLREIDGLEKVEFNITQQNIILMATKYIDKHFSFSVQLMDTLAEVFVIDQHKLPTLQTYATQALVMKAMKNTSPIICIFGDRTIPLNAESVLDILSLSYATEDQAVVRRKRMMQIQTLSANENGQKAVWTYLQGQKQENKKVRAGGHPSITLDGDTIPSLRIGRQFGKITPAV